VGGREEFRVGRLGNELGIEIECVGRMEGSGKKKKGT
jgi:hypothetical protein